MSTAVEARAASAAWTLARGATVVRGEGTRFSVWAPAASRVRVRVRRASERGRSRDGRTRDGRTEEHELEARGRGVFELLVPGVEAGDDYWYILDDGEPRPDPVSRFQPEGVHGPSRVVDPDAFRWTDDAWTGREMADHIGYELHVGTFSDEGTFDGVARHLAELRALGVTAIELMPIAQFPGARNWGYDGAHPYAVQSSYGGPEGLRRLADAAHDAGLAVILDVVYNHLGPEGAYLSQFGPYFTGTYRTPWGLALNYDGPESDEVRRYVVDNALHWVTEYHVDGLRLDAVHAIYDFGARHVLADLADAVRAQGERLGRRVVVIGESDLNDPRVVRAESPQDWGLDAQWADDLHHAIHAALTGERSGYYADFGGVAAIARALEEPFVYAGQYSAHRRRRHGGSSAGLPRDRFVVCIQNHDQTGNRAAGDRITALVGVARHRLAAALYLLSPYVPMLWMGEEYGETNPFLYFVSHGDPELVEAVRAGRRREFEAFGWGDDVPDPQGEETFHRSRLDRTRAALPEHAGLLALYRDLLRLRREERALRPGDADVRVAHDEVEEWITLELEPGVARGSELLAVFNLSGSPRQIPFGATHAGRWRLALSTDDARYGGAGSTPAAELHADAAASASVTLAPHAAALYRRENT